MKNSDIFQHLRPVIVPHIDRRGTVLQIAASYLPGIVSVFVYCPRVDLPDVKELHTKELHNLKPTAFVNVLFDAASTKSWILPDIAMEAPPPSMWRNRQRTIPGSTGVRFVSMGALRNLVDACAGLYPWRAFADPARLDQLLIPGALRPAEAKL